MNHLAALFKTSSFLVLTLYLFQPVSSEPHFVRSRCTPDGSGNYTTNSTYKQNLDLVLTELAENSSFTTSYRATAGSQIGEKGYGLFYCRGDLDTQQCRECIKAAKKQAFNSCPSEKNAVILFQECTLRYYANNSAAFLDEDGKCVGVYSQDYVSDPHEFLVKITMVMDPLIHKAAYGSSSPSFATEEVIVTELQTLHCLVQCSPYVTAEHCDKCLKGALTQVGSCCFNGSTWVMLFNPSCQLRYDFLPFYNTSSSPPVGQPPGLSPSISYHPTNYKQAATSSGKNGTYYITRVVVPAALVLLIVSGFCLCSRRRRVVALKNSLLGQNDFKLHSEEVSRFKYRAMSEATEHFSPSNELGRGGFGVVYRGQLRNGEEVAIKKLSTKSGQGIEEFSTEVNLLAKLQHKNLVRLVGYCAAKDEKLLVYEYVPNLSLDKLLFDPNESNQLDWETRYKIIVGIARGLQYLHHESRDKIVHRDLKTSNILLDAKMNPKIADFGLARLIVVDHTQSVNTSRVAGTLGYMAPEYLMGGRFSFQSDVYSFGTILLEIVAGESIHKRNQTDNDEGLLHRAWRLWGEEAGEELLDQALRNEASRNEVIRCIQIALLCVQHDLNSRPTMQMVLLSLNSNMVDIRDQFLQQPWPMKLSPVQATLIHQEIRINNPKLERSTPRPQTSI